MWQKGFCYKEAGISNVTDETQLLVAIFDKLLQETDWLSIELVDWFIKGGKVEDPEISGLAS